MVKIVLRSTGEVLGTFANLKDADTWHDNWLDTLPNGGEGDEWRVDFMPC